MLEPVAKPTYWDKSLSREERRARAKRVSLPAPEIHDEDEEDDSEQENGDDDELIFQTIAKVTMKLGSSAVGTHVARKFVRRGIFTGEILEYSKEDDLYTVE